MDIIERIDKLRIKNGWSISYFATQIGVSRNAVNDWFNKRQYSSESANDRKHL